MVDEWGSSSAFSAIGVRTKDMHSTAFVTGKYDYALDHNPPGKLYCRVLWAKYAHAKITSINTAKAEALPGVKAVITYKENPNWSDTVLYWGQQIAAVAAVEDVIAERALDLIEVNYDVLNHVLDPEKAREANAPLAGTYPGSNLQATPAVIQYGDVVKGFAAAEVIVDETVGHAAAHTHNEIETDQTVVWWEGSELYCYITSQNPFAQRNSIATALKMPLNQVHVYCHGTGGGFGGKGGTQQEVICALLAKKTGTPVCSNLSRLLYTTNRAHQYGGKLHLKLGFKKDGTLTAIEAEAWNDAGSNAGQGDFMDVGQSSWQCDNFKSSRWAIATNKGPRAAWRCVAHPGGQFLTDLVIEKAAVQLNMNPLALRKKMFLTEPKFLRDKTPLVSFGLNECLDKTAAAIGYATKYHANGQNNIQPDGRLHGIGIHGHYDGHGQMSGTRGAIINMCEDGTVLFNSGASRVHGGYTDKATIIAETIGVPIDSVRCGDWGNTDVSSEGGSQGGSTNTISLGAAFMVAAQDVKTQLFAIAAGSASGMLKTTPDALDAKDGKIFLKADPTKFVTHKAVMAAVEQPIIGRGVRWSPIQWRRPDGKFPVGTPGTSRVGTAAAAEVLVDPETGGIEIINLVNSVDCGRAIDRNMAEAQVMAGLGILANQALFMDDIYDPLTGALLSVGHIHDLISTSMDVPEDKFQAILVESIDANGPYGCHGIGEPAICDYAAIVNAVNNAIGKWIITTPITPKKVLQALGKAL